MTPHDERQGAETREGAEAGRGVDPAVRAAVRGGGQAAGGMVALDRCIQPVSSASFTLQVTRW
ncbi:hypothetical protein GCM10022214_57530 [Actinomadura miaoliensis]|uniref:Uncharacterized protein n=1 Tax=Actinomadura miaoliensis TaxID=430685 RepID=A0ABP7WK39_9ACTN